MCETSVRIGNKLIAFEVPTEIKKQGDNANWDFVARSWSTIMDQFNFWETFKVYTPALRQNKAFHQPR